MDPVNDERWRLVVEGLGALLVIVSAALVSVALGLLAAGVILIIIANAYMGEGEDDASPDINDS